MAILLLVALSLSVGFLLILLMAMTDRKRKKIKSPEYLENPDRFHRTCLDLVDAMKLESLEKEERGSQIDIVARNPTPITGGLLLIRAVFLPPSVVVEIPRILEFSNVVLQERVTKGIFITTGTFSPELKTIVELAPMEFIDGEKFLALCEKYHLR